jgi:hypothetical protein
MSVKDNMRRESDEREIERESDERKRRKRERGKAEESVSEGGRKGGEYAKQREHATATSSTSPRQ